MASGAIVGAFNLTESSMYIPVLGRVKYYFDLSSTVTGVVGTKSSKARSLSSVIADLLRAEAYHTPRPTSS